LANEVAARAIAEAVLVSSTELIEADDGDASAPTVPVVVCLWDRLDRLPRLLRSVQHSVGVRPQIYLWNNRADAVDRVLDDVRSAFQRTGDGRHERPQHRWIRPVLLGA